MSLLELALRKARATTTAEDLPSGARTVGQHVLHSAFVPAWDFAEPADHNHGVERSAAVPAPRPGSVPVPSSEVHHAMRPLRAVDGGLEFLDFNPAYSDKLAMGEQSHPEIREQFRKIAAALYRVRELRPVKVVMVVSAVPGEGKTLTAVNLALTLSESYKSQVLLVDADLRRPSVHRVFGLSNTAGLKERLVAEVDQLLPTAVSPYLAVLTAGTAPVDPMSALVSDRMRAVLGAGASTSDWVILDTPPVELLPDAKLLASFADVAILVVQAGSTKCQLAQRAIEAIGRDRIVGVVLNQVKEADSERHNYDGYYGDGNGQ
ncbi:MAG: polysaccharide biosynthesis tyrosine autokinase [Luteitalea sp.]|nr:polysaccharide biosynthesis tyrosine autokinase [Luteitalea sp.]